MLKSEGLLITNSEELTVIGTDWGDMKSLFEALSDFEFDTLVTTKFIRLLYKILTILGCLVIAVLSLVGMRYMRVLSLVVVPLIGVLYLFVFRIICESAIVRFQMAEDIRAIKNKYVP